MYGYGNYYPERRDYKAYAGVCRMVSTCIHNPRVLCSFVRLCIMCIHEWMCEASESVGECLSVCVCE